MNQRFFTFIMLLIPAFVSAGDFPYAFSAAIVDELGKPVDGAVVSHMFYAKADSPNDLQRDKRTGANGRCEFGGMAYDLGEIEVRKKGFYTSRIKLGEYFDIIYSDGMQKWQNNQEVKVLMKRIINPIPMYAKVEFIKFPESVSRKKMEYDLIAGDFVHPYGSGKTGDLVLDWEVSGDNLREVEWVLSLRFNNEADGIFEYTPPVLTPISKSYVSELRSPNEAPLGGYSSTKEWRSMEGDSSQAVYLFRVRSVVDESGAVVQGLYGKIYGSPRLIRDFKLLANKIKPNGDSLSFWYYLNPNGTRNIEFAPNQNLFKDLPIERRVLNP